MFFLTIYDAKLKMNTDGEGVSKRQKTENFLASSSTPPTTALNGLFTCDSLDVNGDTTTAAVYRAVTSTASTAYIVVNTDYIVEATAVAVKTVTLPAIADSLGRVIEIVNTGVGDLTLKSNGVEQIDGSASDMIIGIYEKIRVIGLPIGWVT